MSVAIVWMADDKSIFRFTFLPFRSDKFSVRSDRGLNLAKDVTKVLVLIEEKNRSFGIAPSHVAEKLINGFCQRLLAGPKFAFSSEYWLPIVPYLDVCLALITKFFGCGVSLIHRVQ